MIKKVFRLNYGDKNLCRLYLPYKNAKNIPVIIYCHGWSCRLSGGGNCSFGASRAVRDLAIANNMAFLSFDQFGEWRTWGNNRYFSHARWGENLNDVYRYVIDSGLTTADKIGCFGISSGTTAAFRMEQKYQKLAFIVSVATCISNNIINVGGPKQFYLDNKEHLDNGKLVKYCHKKISKIFFDDDKENLCIENMDKVKCPIFFLQGGSDNKSRQQDALDGYNILKEMNKATDYFLVEDGMHGLENKAEICAEKTIEFIKATLCMSD